MTRVFEHQTFVGIHDRESGRLFQEMEFRHCTFIGSSLSIVKTPQKRSTLRRVRAVSCRAQGCAIEAAIIEDTVIDGLDTLDLKTWGAVFKHVTLAGKIGKIMINPAVDLYNPASKQQRAFDEANGLYYATVDWALDIAGAEFLEADIRGVPARLIRRDPETQVVVTRAKAVEGRWRQLDLSDTYWPTSIEFLLDRTDNEAVLVAPKRSRRFPQLLRGLHSLREAGVAEPD